MHRSDSSAELPCQQPLKRAACPASQVHSTQASQVSTAAGMEVKLQGDSTAPGRCHGWCTVPSCLDEGIQGSACWPTQASMQNSCWWHAKLDIQVV
jgi:hypothetical protein